MYQESYTILWRHYQMPRVQGMTPEPELGTHVWKEPKPNCCPQTQPLADLTPLGTRFRGLQGFWLTGNTNGNLKKRKNLKGTQLSTDRIHMGVTAHWISKDTRGWNFFKFIFSISVNFSALSLTNWPMEKEFSPSPYFEVWPFSFCSSYFCIFCHEA